MVTDALISCVLDYYTCFSYTVECASKAIVSFTIDAINANNMIL